jgi:hypothetical protein
MAKGRNHKTDAPLTSMFSKKIVIRLAVSAFAIASLLMTFGLIWPERFDNGTARFILCAAISLNLAIFFFVLYPQEIKLTQIPVINLSITLVGPIALYIVLLLLFLKLMPVPSLVAYRLFVPYEGGNRALRISSQAKVSPQDDRFECYIVPDENGLLAGVCVRFESGQDHYKALFKAPYYKTTEVTFDRGAGEGSFQVERNP